MGTVHGPRIAARSYDHHGSRRVCSPQRVRCRCVPHLLLFMAAIFAQPGAPIGLLACVGCVTYWGVARRAGSPWSAIDSAMEHKHRSVGDRGDWQYSEHLVEGVVNLLVVLLGDLLHEAVHGVDRPLLVIASVE